MPDPQPIRRPTPEQVEILRSKVLRHPACSAEEIARLEDLDVRLVRLVLDERRKRDERRTYDRMMRGNVSICG